MIERWFREGEQGVQAVDLGSPVSVGDSLSDEHVVMKRSDAERLLVEAGYRP